MTEQAPASSASPDKHFAAGASVAGNDDTGIGSTQEADFVDGGDTGESKMLTQEQHERSLKNRLARQERKLREELKAQAEEEARRSRMDEVQRLAVERDEALQKAKAREDAANKRVMLAEAKAQAAALGVPQESLKYISKLVELEDVDPDDADAIADAVQQVLKDVPALVKRDEPSGTAEEAPSLATPMGRDRSPAVGGNRPSSSGGPSAKDLFNQRLRNRTAER
jgi:hypothetical protein